MRIGTLNTRIIFQKLAIQKDSIGNHSQKWVNYYKCWANIKFRQNTKSQEKDTTTQIVEQNQIEFEVRFCGKTAEINTTEYRIIFGGRIYNIQSIDIMNMSKKSLKYICNLQ